MANVFDVANFFVYVANQNEDDQMTNLKLNKLLYFAQGAFLSRTGRPLFSAEMEAWPLGQRILSIKPTPIREPSLLPSRVTFYNILYSKN